MGCFFALLSVFTPRLAFLLLWIFTPIVNRIFTSWLWPLLGIIFLPYTTLFYTLIVAAAGPVTIWGWIFVAFGFFIDMKSYTDAYYYRSGWKA